MEYVIGEFLGASVLCLPALLLLSWGLFKALTKNTLRRLPREIAVAISCFTVVGFSLFIGYEGFFPRRLLAYAGVNGIVCLVIGFLFWGRSKSVSLGTSPPKPPKFNSD